MLSKRLYMLPQSDYNSITSGTNGYAASTGYNLVTGLGTPVANVLVPDLIAYQGAGTVYSGPTVGALQDAGLVNTGAGSSSTIDVFSVFDALTVTGNGVGGEPAQGTNGALLTRRAGDGPHATLERGSSVAVGRLGDPSYERMFGLGTRPAQISAIDQVLGTLADADSDNTLIGDLAFEQVSSGTHQPKGSVVTETTR